MKEYFTVDTCASAEFIEKKSRFIGHICPVTTEEAATAFIRSVKSDYWDATHNVWAYILHQGQVKRYSDDGEPRGTAGVPVLDVLEKEELADCVVVVTRYFGGTLLGAGGLVRAYSHGCKIAVDAGGIVVMAPCTSGELICNYSYYEKFLKLAAQFHTVIDESVFQDQIKLAFHLKAEEFEQLNQAVIDSSFGKYQLVPMGEYFQKMKRTTL